MGSTGRPAPLRGLSGPYRGCASLQPPSRIAAASRAIAFRQRTVFGEPTVALLYSMTGFHRRRAQRADRHDDPQPNVGFYVALPAHLVYVRSRLRRRFVAALLNPEMSRARDVEIGRGHRYSITSSARARSAGGIVRPSPFAVLRLIT